MALNFGTYVGLASSAVKSGIPLRNPSISNNALCRSPCRIRILAQLLILLLLIAVLITVLVKRSYHHKQPSVADGDSRSWPRILPLTESIKGSTSR